MRFTWKRAILNLRQDPGMHNRFKVAPTSFFFISLSNKKISVETFQVILYCPWTSGGIKRGHWEEIGYRKLINTCFSLFVNDFSWLNMKKLISRGIKENCDWVFFIIMSFFIDLYEGWRLKFRLFIFLKCTEGKLRQEYQREQKFICLRVLNILRNKNRNIWLVLIDTFG